MFFDRGSSFELFDGQVVYVHAPSKYSKPGRIKGSKLSRHVNFGSSDA
jgi:hypothetical protein